MWSEDCNAKTLTIFSEKLLLLSSFTENGEKVLRFVSQKKKLLHLFRYENNITRERMRNINMMLKVMLFISCLNCTGGYNVKNINEIITTE